MPKRVCYFYCPNIGKFYYGLHHHMKPFRVDLTHNLIYSYKMYKHVDIYRVKKASISEITQFHSETYINYLRTIKSDDDVILDMNEKPMHNISCYDCPIFEGLWEYCRLYTGGSLQAAQLLNQKNYDIAINWAGGLHHAKKTKASGFCYVNDIVIATLELLKYHQRVLYIDIDVHHGDGVQEAFYNTDRVLTLSLHHYAQEFFPTTGHMFELGEDTGRFHSINVPFKKGIRDSGYVRVFKNVMEQIMTYYQPSAIVMQCGADSLIADKLGPFNLTIKGHGECVRIVRDYNLPLLILGGGGYTVKNVARCWTYETALLADYDIPNALPETIYHGYFEQPCLFPVERMTIADENTDMYLEEITKFVARTLRTLKHAPSVQMQYLPATLEDLEKELEDDDEVPVKRRKKGKKKKSKKNKKRYDD